ncbi:hypothetical protein [Haloarcula marismortui]|uniref:Uncharacterized protein n=1 Tax=Haloarcula marismortui ATCC 33800 TaxID=662476 RepID=M0K197_9EURY|nr:hypothetical protein [Haloarcula sinaiiensis]EMA15202.1 hypothetical protein C436_05460 [Haloarcula sinaiiensis ATCC 33800]QUJ71943.1 hypothetical protein KDQ40_14815 [Haloarcula sinaiiensis ATCC 33800]
MATHDDLPPETAKTLLAATERDEIIVSLKSGDALIGPIETVEQENPGEHLDTPGRRTIEFTASDVRFELDMQYREDAEGLPSAESLDLHLTQGHDWRIPITEDINKISQR